MSIQTKRLSLSKEIALASLPALLASWQALFLSLASTSMISSLFIAQPAIAHVKWFLGAKEDAVLSQPKPSLFTHITFENIAACLITLVVFMILLRLSSKLANLILNGRLTKLVNIWEPGINLVLATTTGILLIAGSCNNFVIAPSMVLCPHCPKFILPLEFVTGLSLILGLFTPLSVSGLCVLLAFIAHKYSFADSLDLLPIYGLTVYFMLCGRSLFSLDAKFKLCQFYSAKCIPFAHRLLRWCTGFGLIILAFDEKLLHPQLSMRLLQLFPQINWVRPFGVDDPSFILCAGLGELLIGLMILTGTFPRIATIVIVGLFILTTLIFGEREFIGHMAYYGILFSILLRGNDRTVSSKIYNRSRIFNWLKLPLHSKRCCLT